MVIRFIKRGMANTQLKRKAARRVNPRACLRTFQSAY